MCRHRDEAAQGRSPGKNQRRRIASDEDEDEEEDEGMALDAEDDEEEEEQEQENQGYGRGHRVRRAFNPFGSQFTNGSHDSHDDQPRRGRCRGWGPGSRPGPGPGGRDGAWHSCVRRQ